ncbi:MAG: biotin/lipoyl-binding protein, partial [Sulfuritalea sp.]|nr:biotin/lipoyl-binding protein [Sulfuritalea sp.]
MTGTRKILLLIAVLGAAGSAAWHFGTTTTHSAGKKAKAPAVVPVKLAKAVVRDMPLRLEITGRTLPYETVTLKSRVDGQVRDVAFVEGRQVKQGEVLLRLDPADFQAKLNQMEANLAKSQTQLSKARTDVERYITLRAKGFVSDEKVGDMRTLAAAAESAVKADAAAAELARLQLSYTTI